MPGPHTLETRRSEKSMLDRALSLFTDVRAGEGTTAVLMPINIFVLLICYSVIKTVREPLILLGGGAEVRSIIAAGAGLGLVRGIKTAENATDYSIMNTARQLLWLPTSREEKYKAKQAIDTFFVRSGDVLSAAAVFAGTAILHLTVPQFAAINIVLTLV